jgi:hypothetical protein
MPIREATLRAGMMCPSSTCGRPDILTSHMCVECTIFPSRIFMLRGLGAIHTFFTGVLAITNTNVALVSATECVLGVLGQPI